MMSTALSPLFISSLLFAFGTAADDDVEFVYDLDGNPLATDGVYKILPTNNSQISLAAIPSSAGCKLAVVNSDQVSPFSAKIGTPQSVKYLTTELPITITFSNPPDCAKSGEWVAVQYPSPSNPFLMIGTAEQHPGGIDESGSFGIMKQTGDHIYKLVYCPSSTPNDCTDIGTKVASTEGIRRLALIAGNAMPVRFEKAKGISAASAVSMVTRMNAENQND